MTRACAGLLLLAAAGSTACSRDCADVAVERVVPSDTTVAVGASFTARYQAGGSCSGGPAHYSDVATTWHTSAPGIVSVDSASGRVVAVAVGDAQVSPQVGPSVTIHVR